jgi:hypothetical protein
MEDSMSAIRKIVVSVAAFFLSISAIFMATGTAAADSPWESPAPAISAS